MSIEEAERLLFQYRADSENVKQALPCVCSDPYQCTCRPPEAIEHAANLARLGKLESIEAL